MHMQIDNRAQDCSVRQARQQWAERVIAHFGDGLPNKRLLIVLDSRNCLDFGEWNRGFFGPVNVASVFRWSQCVDHELYKIDPITGDISYLYVCAIYLQDRACADEARLTMTLAHEVQHYIQYCTAPDIRASNTVVSNLHKATIQQLHLDWHSLPIEREARIVAKYVGEELLGEQATMAHIERMEKEHHSPADAKDWAQTKLIDTSQPYDIRSETRELFKRLHPVTQELEKVLDGLRGDPDFANLRVEDFFG